MLATMKETAETHSAQQQPADAQNCTTVHNDAQPEPVSQMHNFAQPPEPYRRPEPKIGRNDPCPSRRLKSVERTLSLPRRDSSRRLSRIARHAQPGGAGPRPAAASEAAPPQRTMQTWS
jgi:hypothetical protein